jgi:hypothetical protein
MQVPINTFPAAAPPSYVAGAESPGVADPASAARRAPTSIIRKEPFKVDRFQDMRGQGY